MAKSFKTMNEPEKGSVVLFDALNLGFRWKHTGAKKFAEDYAATVSSFINSYGNNEGIILADWYSSRYRKEIYPEYKANRKERYAKQTKEEEEAFKAFMEEFERALELLEQSYTILRYKNVEADDLAAYVVKNRDKFGFDKIWLISTDGDWDLLLNEDTSRFAYTTRKEFTIDNWHTHHEVPHEHFLSYKCLVGDTGDNILGIPGIGPKRAEGLIKQYGSAFNIYDNVPLPGTAKYIQNLNEHADRILLNYELIDLLTYCEEAIGQENIEDIDRRLLGDN